MKMNVLIIVLAGMMSISQVSGQWLDCVFLSSDSYVFTADQAGVNPPSQSLVLTEICEGPDNWSAGTGAACDWLSVDPVFGRFYSPLNETHLSIDASGLAKGKYFGTVLVKVWYDNSDTMTQTVEVELNVEVDQPSPYGGGTGTAEDPYQIRTAEQMNAIGEHPKDWDEHFVLMADLDMSSYTGWDLNLIGEERYFALWKGFCGTFDGQGHTLSGLTISKGCFEVGLFRGVVENGVVLNLGLISPTVVVDSVRCGEIFVISTAGILAGTVEEGGLIQNCWIEGGSLEGGNSVGCLVGSNSGTIRNCRISGSVMGLNIVGGLVGSNIGEITNCYSECSVEGTESIGGLAGSNYKGKIVHCYSNGKPTGTSDVGGLCGSKTTGGAFEDSGNFWDVQTSEIVTSTMGTGKTTAEMKTLATFTDAGWDFVGESANGTEDIWRMCIDEVDYPRLAWQRSRVGDFDCPDGVALEDLLYLSQRWLADTSATAGAADATGDGVADIEDFAVVSEHWLLTDPWSRNIVSTFDAGAEGWLVVQVQSGYGLPVTGGAAPAWGAGSGLSGGGIGAEDWYAETFFSAPTAFLGNQSKSFGRNLRFDILINYSDNVAYPAVILHGAAKNLYYSVMPTPVGVWTHRTVPLVGAGWKVNSRTGAAAADADMLEVLSDLQGLYINAEWRTGPDLTYLDNVILEKAQ